MSEHDISKNEAWRIVSGNKFVQFSRSFRNLNLTGNRRVNTDDNRPEASACSTNMADKYWQKNQCPHYARFVQDYNAKNVSFPKSPEDVSLYDFASAFTVKWQPSPTLYVPKPTPMFHYPPVVENIKFREPYCITTLLLHKPGTTPANVSDGFADAEAALLDFVMNDERCPKIIRQEHIKSLKMTEEDVEDLMVNVEDLVPPQGSQRLEQNQEDWMVGLGDPIRVPDINDPEPEVDDGDDENVDTEWDHEADWTSDARLLGLDSQQIKDATDWVKEQRVSADLEVDEEERIDVDSLNSDQKAIFDAVVHASGQKLIDVSGGAGTGKSYLIKALLQNIEDIKIAAPTGCAAQQFSGGQTLHSMLRIPPKMGCKELEQLSPGIFFRVYYSTFTNSLCPSCQSRTAGRIQGD